MQPIPYLFFDGNCREAMETYGGIFGGTPDIMPFAAMPEEDKAQMPGVPTRLRDSTRGAVVAEHAPHVVAVERPFVARNPQTALSIRHGLLPAQLHFETPHPAIPWDEIPIRVQDETTAWPGDGPALAAVNSFGISGTNAHVILESPPELPRSAQRATAARSDRAVLLPLSAHEPQALQERVEQIRDALAAPSGASLEDLAHTRCRAICHHDDAVGEVNSFVDIVGDHHCREPFSIPQIEQNLLEFELGKFVEHSEGLVE